MGKSRTAKAGGAHRAPRGRNATGTTGQHASVSTAAVSESNRSRILRYLYANPASSRAQVAQELGLTPAALTKISARLIDAGVVGETSLTRGKDGRRSIGLTLKSEKFHVVGVKFARTLVQIGVFDLSGRLLDLDELPPVSNDAIDGVVETVRGKIAGLLGRDHKIQAVGMAVPGPYLRDTGRTALVSSMAGWKKVNFLQEFGAEFRVPVYVEQDARAGVLAQSLFGKASSDACLAYYLLGEGVGLGVLDHGRLVNGAQGAATEIGHVSVDINGRPCDCGNVGCLERYCSAVAIRGELAESGLVAGAASMTPAAACRALFDMAGAGDPAAAAMVEKVGRYVGYGCVTIINTFNPTTIIIGDIVSQAGERLLSAAQRVVDERAIPELAQATRIRLSRLPADSAISGAAAVAINQFLDSPSQFLDFSTGVSPP